jgi:hypothetical protein
LEQTNNSSGWLGRESHKTVKRNVSLLNVTKCGNLVRKMEEFSSTDIMYRSAIMSRRSMHLSISVRGAIGT